MKILFTSSYYLPYISGLTVYVSRLGEGLGQNGHQITVLATQHDTNLKLEEEVEGIKIVRIPYWIKISKGFIMPAFLWQSFRQVRQNDIVIINLPQFEGFIPAFWGKLLGKKVLCIYNCKVFLPKGLFNYFVERVLNWANWLTVRIADRVIAYTQDYAAFAGLTPRFQHKLSCIYPPINEPVLKGKKNGFTKLIPKDSGCTIGVAARLSAEKGVEYLLEAIPLLEQRLGKKVSILFAGPKDPVGEEAYLRRLQPLLKKYASKIKFLGTVSQDRMPEFYQAIDVLVLPSINSTEAFGMVQVEAMLLGTPVVTTDLPGVRVPIQETRMGIVVPPKNSQALAEAIIKVFQARARLARRLSIVKKIFDIKNTVKSYEKILAD